MRADLERGRPRPCLVFPVQSSVALGPTASRNTSGAYSPPTEQARLKPPLAHLTSSVNLGINSHQGGKPARVENLGSQPKAADVGPGASQRRGPGVLDYSKWDRIFACENEERADERAISPPDRVSLGADMAAGNVRSDSLGWIEKKVNLAGDLSCTIFKCQYSRLTLRPMSTPAGAVRFLTWLSMLRLSCGKWRLCGG